jgi:hypothetical protein
MTADSMSDIMADGRWPMADGTAWAWAWQKNAKKSGVGQGASTPLPTENIGFTSGGLLKI